MLLHTCSARPRLEKLMEASGGHTTDEHQVLGRTTSIGCGRSKYSLRDESNGFVASRHATRRRAMVVSHSGFRSERQERTRRCAPRRSARSWRLRPTRQRRRLRALQTGWHPKVKRDEARDAKNKRKGVGSVIFVGNMCSDSRFVFPQSITVIHEQEAAAGCAEKTPSASKERKASAKIWRCGDSLCKA